MRAAPAAFSLYAFALLACFATTVPQRLPLGHVQAIDDLAYGVRVARDSLYDEVQQTTIHNAYGLAVPIYDQLRSFGVRSLELDLHRGKLLTEGVSGDWFVYHFNLPGLNDSVCNRLSDCLDGLTKFHRDASDHGPLTIFLDLKDEFGDLYAPSDLDALLLAHLDRSAIVSPKDLREACPKATTLRDAVRGECRWPSIDALAAKTIFVLTGGDLCKDSPLTQYLAAPGERMAFVGPNLSEDCPFSESRERAGSVVFYNLEFDRRAAVPEVHAAGLLTRIYGLDDAERWDEASRTGAQFLATDWLRWP